MQPDHNGCYDLSLDPVSLHGERYETRGEAEEKRRMFLKQCSVRRDVEGERKLVSLVCV